MGKKYNWAVLELEYMKGDWDSVRGFLSEKGVKWTGGAKSRTNGWTKEKEKIKMKAVEESKKKIVAKMVITTDELLTMKKRAMDLINARINQLVFKAPKKDKDGNLIVGEDIPTRDVSEIIRVLKVELGEPTIISKVEDNNNKDYTIVMDPSLAALLPKRQNDQVPIQTDGEANGFPPDEGET